MSESKRTGNVRRSNALLRKQRPLTSSREQRFEAQGAQIDAAALQRAIADASVARPVDILTLQRAAGNHAVGRLIQPKLMVGPVGDEYEREADRVAERLVSMPASAGDDRSVASRQAGVQRQEEEELLQGKQLVQRQEEEEELLQGKQLVQRQEEEELLQGKRLVQRQEEEEELQPKRAEVLQRQADGGFQADSDLESRLARRKGAGRPLSDAARAFMEPRFGADFSGVRVHTDSEAVQMNRKLSARAFTYGPDIYFGSGSYDPAATTGKRLLAHELTHVVQQGAVGQSQPGQVRSSAVQRFPASAVTTPYKKWNKHTITVGSPGEGAKGGVFILTDEDERQPLQKVVVKPLYDEGAAQSQLADKFLQAMGVNVPDSRFIAQGEGEFRQLADIVGARYQEKVADPQTELVPIDELFGFKLMAMAPAEGSLAALAKGLRTQDDIDRLISILRQSAVYAAIGRMMVADAAIGNDDRVAMRSGVPFLNLGNILSAVNGDLWAIDSAAQLTQTETKPTLAAMVAGTIPDLLDYLSEPGAVRWVARDFVEVMKRFAQQAQAAPGVNPPPGNQIAAFLDARVGIIEGALRVGVQHGFFELENVLKGKTERAKETRRELKSEAGGEAYGEAAASQKTSWRTLKARYEMHKTYAGTSPKTAVPAEIPASPGTYRLPLDQAAKAAQEQAGKAYLARKDPKMSAHMQRVLRFGVKEGLLSGAEVVALREVVVGGDVSSGDQDKMLHLRAGTRKKTQIGTAEIKINLEKRLDATRVGLVKHFLANQDVAVTTAQAARLLKAGVGQLRFMTSGGRESAETELKGFGAQVGVDLERYF